MVSNNELCKIIIANFLNAFFSIIINDIIVEIFVFMES